MMFRHLECIVKFVCIFGVFGNIGPKKEGKGENARVMEVCMIH